jgi:hypothetical protein
MTKVRQALNKVRDAVSSAATGLNHDEYNQFLEELCADAAGWSMELDEREAEDDESGL